MVQTKTSMGMCHTFHPESFIQDHGALKSRKAGFFGGLQFILNVEQEEYVVSDTDSPNNVMAGIMVT